MKALCLTALCAALAAPRLNLHLIFPHARSGVIAGGGGSNANLEEEIAASDPKVATLGSVAVDALRSDQVAAEKFALVEIKNGRVVAIATPADGATAVASWNTSNTAVLQATLSKDNPNDPSSPWTAVPVGGSEYGPAIPAIVAASKPVRTVAAMVSALEDALLNPGATLLGAGLLVIDQVAETIRFYGGTEIDGDSLEALAVECEAMFVQAPAPLSPTEERLFGE